MPKFRIAYQGKELTVDVPDPPIGGDTAEICRHYLALPDSAEATALLCRTALESSKEPGHAVPPPMLRHVAAQKAYAKENGLPDPQFYDSDLHVIARSALERIWVKCREAAWDAFKAQTRIRRQPNDAAPIVEPLEE